MTNYLLANQVQIMIIDDYSSMKRYMNEVKKVARVISYVVKTADDNGMEIYPASKTAKNPRICETSSQIEKVIDKMETVDGKCDMGASLEHVFEKLLVDGRKVKHTSIYIYTDGVWEPGTNVKRVVDAAIEHLEKHGQSTRTLMLQFIQFGHDTKGTEDLKFLDNDCTKRADLET